MYTETAEGFNILHQVLHVVSIHASSVCPRHVLWVSLIKKP